MSLSFIRVGDLSDQIRGVTYGKEDASKTPKDGYLPVLRAGNITEHGLIYSDLVYVPTGKISPKQKIKRGDIVIAASSGSLDVVGKAAPALDDFDGGFGAFCKVIRPNQKVDSKYLAHFFKTPEYRTIISSLAAGANINNLRSEHLDDLLVPLPSLPEQRRIAAILDEADALRTKRREALAQLDSLTKSVFIEMFGDPMTNPMGWDCKPFSEIGKVVTGNTPSRDMPDYYGNAIEWIKSDNINTPHYYLTKATEGLSNSGKAVGRTVPPFSILVTCIAGSPECIGNAAMTDREVAFNQQINAFVPTSVDPHFIYAQILIGKKLIQEASTNGMKGMVSKSRFEKIMLMEPDLALQKKFAIRAQAIEALKASHVVSLTKLDALFASLQHRAFQGEL